MMSLTACICAPGISRPASGRTSRSPSCRSRICPPPSPPPMPIPALISPSVSSLDTLKKSTLSFPWESRRDSRSGTAAPCTDGFGVSTRNATARWPGRERSSSAPTWTALPSPAVALSDSDLSCSCACAASLPSSPPPSWTPPVYPAAPTSLSVFGLAVLAEHERGDERRVAPQVDAVQAGRQRAAQVAPERVVELDLAGPLALVDDLGPRGAVHSGRDVGVGRDPRSGAGRRLAVDDPGDVDVLLARLDRRVVLVDAEHVEREIVELAERVGQPERGRDARDRAVVELRGVAQEPLERARRRDRLLELVGLLGRDLEHPRAPEPAAGGRLRRGAQPVVADLRLRAGEQLPLDLGGVDQGEARGAVGEVLADQDRVLADLHDADEQLEVRIVLRAADQAALERQLGALLAGPPPAIVQISRSTVPEIDPPRPAVNSAATITETISSMPMYSAAVWPRWSRQAGADGRGSGMSGTVPRARAGRERRRAQPAGGTVPASARDPGTQDGPGARCAPGPSGEIVAPVRRRGRSPTAGRRSPTTAAAGRRRVAAVRAAVSDVRDEIADGIADRRADAGTEQRRDDHRHDEQDAHVLRGGLAALLPSPRCEARPQDAPPDVQSAEGVLDVDGDVRHGAEPPVGSGDRMTAVNLRRPSGPRERRGTQLAWDRGPNSHGTPAAGPAWRPAPRWSRCHSPSPT